MGVSVFVAIALLSVLSPISADYEDFDGYRTAGFEPIEEKRELFLSDLEELARIRSNRADKECPADFVCPKQFKVSELSEDEAAKLCADDQKPVQQCYGIEKGCDCVIWTCAAKNCSLLVKQTKYSKDAPCVDKCQSRQKAMSCGCRVYTCQNTMCSNEKPKCDDECQKPKLVDTDSCNCPVWKCAPNDVKPPVDRKECDASKDNTCSKCQTCKTFYPLGKKCAAKHPALKLDLCEPVKCPHTEKCDECQLFVPSKDGCCGKCYTPPAPPTHETCDDECEDAVQEKAFPELVECNKTVTKCVKKKCPPLEKVTCSPCEKVALVPSGKGKCPCSKRVCVSKCPTPAVPEYNEKCEKLTKVVTDKACKCTKLTVVKKDFPCGQACKGQKTVGKDECGLDILECEGGKKEVCQDGCRICRDVKCANVTKPVCKNECDILKEVSKDKNKCPVFECQKKTAADVVCTEKCAVAKESDEKDGNGCPKFTCEPAKCNCKENEICVTTKDGCKKCEVACPTDPKCTEECEKPAVVGTFTTKKGAKCQEKKCAPIMCDVPPVPADCNKKCSDWVKKDVPGKCCGKYVCLPKGKNKEGACSKCDAKCEKCVKKYDEDCENIIWTCEKNCPKIADNEKQCYEQKTDDKSGAPAVDGCGCPVMELKPRPPAFDATTCPKGSVKVEGKDACNNTVPTCKKCEDVSELPKCSDCQELSPIETPLQGECPKPRKCVKKKCAEKEEMKKCKLPCEREVVTLNKCGCCHVECVKSCPKLKKCRPGFTALVVIDSCGCKVLSECVMLPPQVTTTPAGLLISTTAPGGGAGTTPGGTGGAGTTPGGTGGAGTTPEGTGGAGTTPGGTGGAGTTPGGAGGASTSPGGSGVGTTPSGAVVTSETGLTTAKPKNPSIIVEPVCEEAKVCTKYLEVSKKKCQKCGPRN